MPGLHRGERDPYGTGTGGYQGGRLQRVGCIHLWKFRTGDFRDLLAKHFDGPKMFVAAAEESRDNLVQGRGDASTAVAC